MFDDKTPNNTPLIRVEWEDIKFVDNWGEEDEPIHPVECLTEGRELHRSDTEVILGSSYDWDACRWGTIHAISLAVPRIRTLIEP